MRARGGRAALAAAAYGFLPDRVRLEFDASYMQMAGERKL